MLEKRVILTATVQIYTANDDIVNKKMTTSPNNVEQSLSNLAELLSIPLKRGWKTRVSEWFRIELKVLSKWLERGDIPKYRIKEVVKKGYPKKKWYVPPEALSESETGTTTTKKMLSISNKVAASEKTTHKPEHKEYFESLKEILESDDEETKHAIISNLKAFVRTVRMNQRLLQIDNPENENNSGSK